MKHLNKILLFAVLLCMADNKASAYTACIDGIYYNFSGANATVTYYDLNSNSTVYTGDIVIPETVVYNEKTYSVTSIGDYAFYKCSDLTSVTIPNKVTTIGNYTFQDCSSLTSITIPNSVINIGRNAFYKCSSLTSITIPNSVTAIGKYAFSYCSNLTSAIIPDGVTTIGNGMFSGCLSLTSVTIPNGVTLIGEFAFQNCSSLSSVSIPNSVTNIGIFAFQECTNMKKVIVNDISAWCKISFGGTMDSNPLYYARHLYSDENTEITDLVIPDDVTAIGAFTFCCCPNFTSITIPNSVTSIGNYAFYICSSLTSITIPNSVTNIGKYAFYGYNNLKEVVSLIDEPYDISSDVFSNTTYSGKLYVPMGTLDKYKASEGWNKFTNIVEGVPSDIQNISDSTKDEIKEVSRYSLNGKKIMSQQHGVNIVKMSDGTTKKVIVK